MTPDEMAKKIAGGDSLIAFFGSWPTFHDSEILEICLNRAGWSWVRVYAYGWWEVPRPDGPPAVSKDVIVTFYLDSVSNLSLEDFSGQNVVGGITVDAVDRGLRLVLHPTYGVGGYIECAAIKVVLDALSSGN